jgi:hypothetical protein
MLTSAREGPKNIDNGDYVQKTNENSRFGGKVASFSRHTVVRQQHLRQRSRGPASVSRLEALVSWDFPISPRVPCTCRASGMPACALTKS